MKLDTEREMMTLLHFPLVAGFEDEGSVAIYVRKIASFRLIEKQMAG